jgi:zinc finger protein
MDGSFITSSIERNESISEEEEETLKLPTSCSNCQQPAALVVRTTSIPHFQQVVLMCMVCEHCGFKTTEVKNSRSMPIPSHGTRMTLTIRDVEDLNRAIVLSDSAGVSIPDLELEQQEGGFDGIITTVEGLLRKLLTRLDNVIPFGSEPAVGGNATTDIQVQQRYMAFLSKLRSLSEGRHFPFKLVVNDPLSASHIGPRPDSPQFDTNDGLVIEQTERSSNLDESLGV